MKRRCCFVEDYQLPDDRASPFQSYYFRNCHCLEKHYSTTFAKPIETPTLTRESVTRCNVCCGGFVYRENFQYCGNEHLAITGINNDSVRYLTGGEVRTISNLSLPYLRTHPWVTPLTPCNLDRNVQVHFLRFNNSSTESLVPQLRALQNHYNLEEDSEYVHGRCNKILNDLSKNVYCTYPVDEEVFYVTSKRCTPKQERVTANQNGATCNKNLDKKVPQDPFCKRYPIVLEVLSPIKPAQQCDSMYIFANDDDMYAHVCSKCAAVILDTLAVCTEDATKNQKLNNVKPHVNSGQKKKMKVDRCNNMKKNKPKVTMDTPKKDTQRPGRPKTRRNLSDTPYQPKTKSRGQSSKSNSSKERSPGPVRKPKRSRTPSAQRAKSQEQSTRNSSASSHAAGDTRKASTEKGSSTREVESLIKDSINEHEYLQFSLRITEDIIKNDLYTCNEMRRVFNSHIEANRGRLDINKMKEQVRNLAKELNVKYDNPDGYSLGPHNWVNSCGYPKDDDTRCDLIYVAKDMRDFENLDSCNRDSQRYQHKSSRCTSTSYTPPARYICTTPLMKCSELVELPPSTGVDTSSGSTKSNKQCEELISLSCETPGVENTCAGMHKPANQDTVPAHKNVCDEKLCGLTLVVTVPDQEPTAAKLSNSAEDKPVDSIVNKLDADYKEEVSKLGQLKQLDQTAIKTDECTKMSRSTMARCAANVNFCHLHSTTMMTTEIIPDTRLCKEEYGNKLVQVDASSFKPSNSNRINICREKDFPIHVPDTERGMCEKKCSNQTDQINASKGDDHFSICREADCIFTVYDTGPVSYNIASKQVAAEINRCRGKDFPIHVPNTERGMCEKKCSNQIDQINASKGDDHFSICREADCIFTAYDTGPVSYNIAPKQVAALNKLKTTDLQSAAYRKPMQVNQEYLAASFMQTTTLQDDNTVLSNSAEETVVIPQTQQQPKCSCPCCVKAGCDSIWNDRDDVYNESIGSSQESPKKDITSYIDKRMQEKTQSMEPKVGDCENEGPIQNGQMHHEPSNVGTQTLVSNDIDLQPEKEKIKYNCQESSTDYITGDTYRGDIPKMLAQFFPSTATQTTSSDLLLIDEILEKQQQEKELLKKEEKLEVGTPEKILSSENFLMAESEDEVFQHSTDNIPTNTPTNLPQHVQYDKSYEPSDRDTELSSTISELSRPVISNHDESNLIRSISDNIESRRLSKPYGSAMKPISSDHHGMIASTAVRKSYDSNSDESIGRIFDDNEMCAISHSVKSIQSGDVHGKTAGSTSDVQGKTATSTSDVQGKAASSSSNVQGKTSSNTGDVQGKTPSNSQKKTCDRSSYESTGCVYDEQDDSIFSHCSISIIISEGQQRKQKSKQSIISDHINDELEQETMIASKEDIEKNPSDIDTFMNKLDYRPRVSVTGSMDKRVKKTLTEGEMFRNPEIRRIDFETQSGIDLNVDQTIVEDTERRTDMHTHKEEDTDTLSDNT